MCLVYIPPEASTREKRINVDHFKQLKETTAKIDSSSIILIGDFNARTGQLEDTLIQGKHERDVPIDFYSKITSRRNNQDKTVNNYGKQLSNYCISTQSYIVNGRTIGDLQGKLTCYEWNGASAVDYAIITENLSKKIKMFQVLDPSIGSDHCPIKMEIEMKEMVLSKLDSCKTYEKPPPIRWNTKTETIFKNRMDSREMNQLLTEIDTLLDNDSGDMEIIIDKIGEIYTIGHEVKTEKKKKKNKPKTVKKKWYDKSCQELSRQLKQTAKLLSRSPNNPNIRGNFHKTRKQYKKLIKTKKKEWKNQMVQKLEQIEENKPEEYWKLVNELREKKKNDIEFDHERFTKFFENLYSASDDKDEDIENRVIAILEQYPVFSNEPDFTIEELTTAIKALKNNKATGLDRIPAEMIKSSSGNITMILLKTMNKIKTTFNCPTKWAAGITSLLLKDGDVEDPNNYRAITVIDALSKVLAILLNNRLEKWCSENKVIKKEQIGFEKKSRPGDHLFVPKSLIDAYNQQEKKIYACFVDFEKAFDSVCSDILLRKILVLRITGNFFNILRHIYTTD